MNMTSAKMRFIDVKDTTIAFNEMAIPTPSSNQCLIKVKAIGINRADLLQKAGLYPPPAGESPILGIEVAGEIVGGNTGNFTLGDRVCGIVAGGGYAEYAVIDKDHLIKLPMHFSFAQGAALAETYLTAYQALCAIGQLKQNEKVLIHAGASGVGTAAIQLAKAKGCFVAVTVGNEAKMNACKALGADITINYNTTSFSHWAKTNQHHFNVILDVVAGSYVNQNIKVAAVDARIVVLAILGGRYAEQLDVARMLQKRVTLSASTLRNRSDTYKADLVQAFTSEFTQLLYGQSLSHEQLQPKDLIQPVIDTVFSWQEVELAHQKMAENKNIGKLVMTVDE